MFDPQSEKDEAREQSPAERAAVIGLAMIFTVMVGLDLAEDFVPAKWAVPLMGVFWMPLLVIHELGHALAAAALGWRIERVVLGFGRVRWQGRVAGRDVELRTLPVEGFVQTQPREGEPRPLQHAFIYFAGPGIELVAAGLVLLAVGPATLLAPSAALPVIAAQSFAAAATLGAVINLIPHSQLKRDGEVPNDGLGILLALGAAVGSRRGRGSS